MGFKARFEMRITPELLLEVGKAARWKKLSVSTFVRDAIREKITKTKEEWHRWKSGQPIENARDL
jgi:metal-responsive CopG/Arc/MetJ family transcriptional regulator